MRHLGSFTSANEFPSKLLCNLPDLEGFLHPIHPQLIPTNVCNQNCSYCSCGKREGREHMDWNVFQNTIHKMKQMGAKAYTVTGGGEPMLHPEINDMLAHLRHAGMKIGLVTNGIALGGLEEGLAKDLAWCRVSWHTDRLQLPDTRVLKEHAYSVVYSPGDELNPTFKGLIRMAAAGQITHLRIVSDITRADDADYSSAFRLGLRDLIMDPEPNVIVQDREHYTCGATRCWISLIKPLVDVDGQVYPCCGAQYALDLDSRKFPPEMSMGDVDTYLSTRVNNQVPFDGSKCKVCYYQAYNTFLDTLVFKGHIQHPEFL